MRARFLADADLRFAIVRGFWRKVPECHFLAAAGQLSESMPDPEVLNLAAKLGRVLVSHDFETMPAHLYKLLETTESPGIVLIPQGLHTGRAIEQLEMIWHLMEVGEFKNRILYLPL